MRKEAALFLSASLHLLADLRDVPEADKRATSPLDSTSVLLRATQNCFIFRGICTFKMRFTFDAGTAAAVPTASPC